MGGLKSIAGCLVSEKLRTTDLAQKGFFSPPEIARSSVQKMTPNKFNLGAGNKYLMGRAIDHHCKLPRGADFLLLDVSL